MPPRWRRDGLQHSPVGTAVPDSAGNCLRFCPHHVGICAMNGGVYLTVPALTASWLDYSELQPWAATHTADSPPGFLRSIPPRDSGPANWKLEKWIITEGRRLGLQLLSAFAQEHRPVSEDPHSLLPVNFSFSPVLVIWKRPNNKTFWQNIFLFCGCRLMNSD